MYYKKPSDGYITSFMSKGRTHPIAGVIRPHQGVDIGSSANNNIWAAADGQVIQTGHNSTAGNFVLIRHSNGQTTSYSHLASIKVKSGMVKQGQVIGIKGATGSATGIHLHFEIANGPWTASYANKLNPLLHFVDPLTKEMQGYLKQLGYDVDVDGVYGDKTITAVALYQKRNGLTVDGYAGRGTHMALKAEAVKKPTPPIVAADDKKEEEDELAQKLGVTQKADMKKLCKKAYVEKVFSVDHTSKVDNMTRGEALDLLISYNARSK